MHKPVAAISRQRCLILSSLLLFFINEAVAAGEEEEMPSVDLTSAGFWGQVIAILALVSASGIVAGLTLGIMSLDTTNLKILQIAGSPTQQYHASKILPIRQNGHILLTALLLTNTALNETLPILFDSIIGKGNHHGATGFISVIISTALLVLFAEIIPQAIFSKHGLAIGAFFAVPVKFFIAIWYVIAWPIAKFLDYMLGTHSGFMYDISELSALVKIHDQTQSASGTLKQETANIIQNTLVMQENYAAEIMTSVHDMLLMKSDTSITLSEVLRFLDNGYSHVFVYDVKSEDQQNHQPILGAEASEIPRRDQDRHDYSHYQIRGALDLKALSDIEDDEYYKQPVGKMKLEPYLTASLRTSQIELLSKVLRHNKKEIILVYCTQEDIKAIKSEREKEAETRLLMEQKVAAKNRHTKSVKCIIRKLFRSTCPVCQRAKHDHNNKRNSGITTTTGSISFDNTRSVINEKHQTTMRDFSLSVTSRQITMTDEEEEEAIVGSSSLTTIFDNNNWEPGLAGMLTSTAILNQFVGQVSTSKSHRYLNMQLSDNGSATLEEGISCNNSTHQLAMKDIDHQKKPHDVLPLSKIMLS